MIASIADKNTRKVLQGEPCKKLPPSIQDTARDVLAIIDGLVKIEETWGVPGLKAHKLTERGRTNLWSVRINDQWRIKFDWVAETSEAHNVEITDYH